MIDLSGLARVFHVVGVVIWIGGVGFVTVVLLPALHRVEPMKRAELFQSMESRFAWVARAMIVIVGASGFYMAAVLDLWDRFASPLFWWMDAMVAIWSLFALLLFIAEPLFLHRRFAEGLAADPEGTLRRMHLFHWVLLIASLVTIMGAVAGAHGYALFG
jgi:uncharacterized membrane protein